ncbi:MAG: regulatory protein RecX [Lachnospiraceae bacterium]
MIVTELVESSSSRVKVYIDQEFAFVLYKGELRKYGLKEGQVIRPEAYEELLHEVLPKRAKLRCMNLLKSRDYTREQLRTKLAQGFYPDEVIEEALAYVASFHYIDDLRYAEDFINCSHTHKSRRRIENDLLKKGIPADTIAKAWNRWEDAGNEQDEEEQIARLLEKKHFDAEHADGKELQRMYAFLARRGFSGEKIRRALLK